MLMKEARQLVCDNCLDTTELFMLSFYITGVFVWGRCKHTQKATFFDLGRADASQKATFFDFGRTDASNSPCPQPKAKFKIVFRRLSVKLMVAFYCTLWDDYSLKRGPSIEYCNNAGGRIDW